MPYGRRNFRRKPIKRVRVVAKAKPAAMVPRRKSTKKAYPRYRLTAPMRALVDRRINRKLEPIHLRYSLTVPTTGAGDNAYTLRNEISGLSMIPILPMIKSAASSQEPWIPDAPFRRGNEIQPKYMYLKIRLYVDAGDTTAGASAGDRCAIQPVVFVGYDKEIRSYDPGGLQDVINNFWTSWANNGQYPTSVNAGSEAYDADKFRGSRAQFMHGQLNRKRLVPYLYKTPVLKRDLGYTYGDLTAGGAGYAGNFLPEVTYNVKIPLPSTMKYDADAYYPSNVKFPLLAVGFTYMNGAPPSQEAPLRMETSVHFCYTDA